MQKKYDIAISFAGEDREIANGIALILQAEGVSVFYDEFEKADLWGKDLYEHLISVYKDDSKYCLMLLSENYSKKLWTSHERKAAQARAFNESKEYILPLRIDDAEVTGILGTTGYLDYRNETNESVAQQILIKLWGDLKNDKGLKAIKEKLEGLYSHVMLTCDLVFMPSDHHSIKMFGYSPKFHRESVTLLAKVRSDLEINASNIDGLVIGQITEFLDSIENILEMARFLLNLNNPSYKNYDFVGEFPETDFQKVFDFLNKLNIFDGYAVMNKKHYKPQDIITNWKRAEKETDNYYSNLKTFTTKKGRIPFIYDSHNVRKIGPHHNFDKIRIFRD